MSALATTTSFFPEYATQWNRSDVEPASSNLKPIDESYADYFSQLLKNRMEYLQGLHSLGDDWISGNAKAPSKDALRNAYALLEVMQSISKLIPVGLIPKLTMSPIPSGGVNIVIGNFQRSSALSYTFHNNAKVEIEYEQNDGRFGEIDTTSVASMIQSMSGLLREYFDKSRD